MSCKNAIITCPCTPVFQTGLPPNTVVVFGNQIVSGSVNGGFASFVNKGFVPAFAIVTVKRGTGDMQMFATVQEGSISAFGFQYDLSGLTDANDYQLDYLLLGPQAATPFYYNSFNIPSGVSSGTITGLALPFFPGQVITTVLRNSGGQLMWATVNNSSITQDGFSFDLSGVTDAADYVLDYIVIPAVLSTTAFAHGTAQIPINANGGTVAGLGLSFSPCQILLQVRRGNGQLLMYADCIASSVTNDGFSYTLNGITDSGDYYLDYMLIPCGGLSFSSADIANPANIDNGDPVIAAGQWQTVFLGLPPNTPPSDENYFLQIDPSSGWQDQAHTIWNTILNWSYPPSMLTTLQANDILIQFLYIQRSSVALNMPNLAANVYALTSLPPGALSDPNWTTIFSGAGFVYPPPTTFTDTTVPDPWFAYRIIIVLQPAP